MQKTIDINNQKLKITSDNSRIEFVLDNHILFSGIPFNDVYYYDDVEIKDNKILLTARVQEITKTRDMITKKLVPVVREFDTSLFTHPETSTSSEKVEDSSEEVTDDESVGE